VNQETEFTEQEFIDFATGHGYSRSFAQRVFNILKRQEAAIDPTTFLELTMVRAEAEGMWWLGRRAAKTWELITAYQAHLRE